MCAVWSENQSPSPANPHMYINKKQTIFIILQATTLAKIFPQGRQCGSWSGDTRGLTYTYSVSKPLAFYMILYIMSFRISSIIYYSSYITQFWLLPGGVHGMGRHVVIWFVVNGLKKSPQTRFLIRKIITWNYANTYLWYMVGKLRVSATAWCNWWRDSGNISWDNQQQPRPVLAKNA